MAIVASRIDSVTIFKEGARVVRRVELKGGPDGLPQQLEIGTLPLSLIDPTARARVVQVEPKGAVVAATCIRVGMRAQTQGEGAEEEDRRRLEALERRQMVAAALLRQLDVELELLRSIGILPRPAAEAGKAPPASPMSARVALERFSDEAIGERLERARQLRRELRELERDAGELRDRLQRATSAREAKPHELFKTMIVQLDRQGRPAERAVLLVEYHVPGARWAPAYTLEMSRDGVEAQLKMRAVVAQRTGEDWRGVRLTLCTADALSWSEKPELTAIRIGRSQAAPPAPRGFRPPPRSASSLFSDYDAGHSATRQLLPPASQWRARALHPVAPDLFAELEEVLGFGDESGTPVGERTAQMLMPSPMELAAGMASFSVPEEAEALVAHEAVDKLAPVPAMAPLAVHTPPMRRRHPSAEVTRRVSPAEPVVAERSSLRLPFSQLQLAGPDVRSARNRLLPRDARANYMETLRSDGIEVELDVMNVVGEARQRAEEIASLPLPAQLPEREEQGGFDYSYETDAVVDVEGNGVAHAVHVGARASKSEMRYVSVPREERAVYRAARLENPLPSPLLPGPAEIYIGGQFVLTAQLPLVAPRGHFELGLGVEQAIKVARNTRYEERRSDEKVVAMTELAHQIEIELANHLTRSIRCEVRERLPQPDENAEVVVEEGRVDPPWEAYDQRERGEELVGGRRWLLELAPREARTLQASYSVKIYANNELVGGNRREA